MPAATTGRTAVLPIAIIGQDLLHTASQINRKPLGMRAAENGWLVKNQQVKIAPKRIFTREDAIFNASDGSIA